MTAWRGHKGRRARLHGRGPPLTSPSRPGRPQKAPPSGRSAPPVEEGEVKGAARRALGAGTARGRPPARGGGARAGGSGCRGLSRALSPHRSLAAAPSLLLWASNRPRACAHARVPAEQPALRRFTPARGPSHRASFCSRLVRGLGRIIGERELGFCQSLYGWVRLEVGRGNGEKV